MQFPKRLFFIMYTAKATKRQRNANPVYQNFMWANQAKYQVIIDKYQQDHTACRLCSDKFILAEINTNLGYNYLDLKLYSLGRWGLMNSDNEQKEQSLQNSDNQNQENQLVLSTCTILFFHYYYLTLLTLGKKKPQVFQRSHPDHTSISTLNHNINPSF